jgi:hypothetical protein
MEQIQKPNDYDCYTTSAGPLKIDLQVLGVIFFFMNRLSTLSIKSKNQSKDISVTGRGSL